MLDSLIRARDKFLKPLGLMFPSHCTMYIGMYEDFTVVVGYFVLVDLTLMLNNVSLHIQHRLLMRKNDINLVTNMGKQCKIGLNSLKILRTWYVCLII